LLISIVGCCNRLISEAANGLWLLSDLVQGCSCVGVALVGGELEEARSLALVLGEATAITLRGTGSALKPRTLLRVLTNSSKSISGVLTKCSNH
jgi:hypothetical protein